MKVCYPTVFVLLLQGLQALYRHRYILLMCGYIRCVSIYIYIVIDKIFGLETAQKCQVLSLFSGLGGTACRVCRSPAPLCELAFGLCCHKF